MSSIPHSGLGEPLSGDWTRRCSTKSSSSLWSGTWHSGKGTQAAEPKLKLNFLGLLVNVWAANRLKYRTFTMLCFSTVCVQHSNSDTHTHIFLFQIVFPCSLLQDTEYSSLCYMVGLCYLSIYIQQCVSANPKLLIYPSPTPFPFW